jgi:hypothetical protein
MREAHTMSTITSPRPPAHFPGDADTSLVAATANLPVSADRPFARTLAPLGAPDVIASRASAMHGCDLQPPARPSRRHESSAAPWRGRPGRQTQTAEWWEMRTTTQPAPTRLTVNEHGARRCSPPRCSHRTPQPPKWSPRQSAPVSGSSVSVAAPAGWHRSSATTPTRLPAGCAGYASSPTWPEAEDERDL